MQILTLPNSAGKSASMLKRWDISMCHVGRTYLICLATILGYELSAAGQSEILASKSITAPDEAAAFSLKEPVHIDGLVKKPVWFTAYIDYLVDEDTGPNAVPLLGPDGQALHVGLSNSSWCRAANEGTISLQLKNGGERSFNYLSHNAAERIGHCASVFRTYQEREIDNLERSLFSELPGDAPYGLGAKNTYRLVPARSVAVDLGPDGLFKLGDVLYVPALRGLPVKLQDGSMVQHDGYVMVVDKVSACSGGEGNLPVNCNFNHVDYFLGRMRVDHLPANLQSSPAHTLDVYEVTDQAIIDKLKAEHIRK